MIWTVIFGFAAEALNLIFSVLPQVVTLDKVSFAGHTLDTGLGIDSALVTAFGYFNGFLEVFWPLQILWVMVLWYYGIKVALFFLRMIPFIGKAVV